MFLHMLGFFMMCFVGMYVLTSLFLSVGDAENLSLLTSDTYGVAWVDVQSTVELILVMKLPVEQTRRLSWRLGLASALMVAHGYSGEIQDNLLVRWFWWALAMVSFCFVAVRDETPLVSPDDYLASNLFMPGRRLTQYGLTDHSAVKHRWYFLPTMQMDGVLPFERSDPDTVLTGCMTFHAALADPIVRPDSPERQSIECGCRAFLLFPDFEPDARPESVDPVKSDAEVEAAVQRSFGLICAMSSWLGAAKTWLMTTSAKLGRCARNSADACA